MEELDRSAQIPQSSKETSSNTFEMNYSDWLHLLLTSVLLWLNGSKSLQPVSKIWLEKPSQESRNCHSSILIFSSDELRNKKKCAEWGFSLFSGREKHFAKIISVSDCGDILQLEAVYCISLQEMNEILITVRYRRSNSTKKSAHNHFFKIILGLFEPFL